MGIRAVLTRIPPEIFEAVRESGGFEPNENLLSKKYNWFGFTSINLDKSWWILNKAFVSAGPPLRHALEGDYFPEGGLDAFDGSDDVDSYLAYVSPANTKLISMQLNDFPIKQALQALLEDDVQYIEYCLPYFEDLVNLYEEATYYNEAVFISVF